MKQIIAHRLLSKLVFGWLVLQLISCNLVWMYKNRTAKKLTKIEIVNAEYKTDSLQINYWKGGKGPVLVFIHGFGGDALMNWHKHLQHYAKTNTVVACDLLWFGKSTSKGNPNLSTQVDAVHQLLTSLKIDSASFIGQSYGGFVVLDYAHQYPEQVTKLVIANSPGSTFDVSILDTLCAKSNVQNVADFFVLDDPKNIQRLINLATYSNPHIPKFLLKQMYEEYFVNFHEEERLLMQTLPMEQNRLIDLSVIQRIPTLVLWGENDEIFPKHEGEKFASAAHAQFVCLPKCGHAPQIDAPKAFQEILDQFLLPVIP